MNKFKLVSLLVGLMLAAGGLTQSLPAHTFSEPFFPTQSFGNKGVDVKAIQYLLNNRNYGLTVSGNFDATLDTAVKRFQLANGLTVDGIVGPNTWAALIVTVLQKSPHDNAIKAVQLLLNEKHRAGLVVDGIFGINTHNAVIAFQEHAGIKKDGIVGPDTWRNLLWHYDTFNSDMTGLVCNISPTVHWGTGAAIGQLEVAVGSFHASYPTPVRVGDISYEHGGAMPPHASHQVGLDVDIRPIRTDNAQCTTALTWRDPAYDRARTRALIQTIRASAPGHIKVIWFNDPQLIREGLTTYLDDHDNHLHIRYCEKVHLNSRYDC